MPPALKKNIDYYLDTEGRWVFTRHYHLERGYCCSNGCLHCPYGKATMPAGPENPEQKLTEYEVKANSG